MDKYLRNTKIEDCHLFFQWSNDDTVRKNAFNSQKFDYEDHCKWFNNKLNCESTHMYILIDSNIPIGQIRIDIFGNYAEIDYSIGCEYRNQGNGGLILNLLEDEIYKNNLKINKLIGKVKYSNIQSQKAFEKNNYFKIERDKYIEYVKEIN